MSFSTDTLKIKNLPKELSESQKENFARHFGATKVKVITSRAKEKAVVYAKFDNSEIAKNVLHRIHQIKVLNSRLCVEYAENNILQGKPLLKTVGASDTPDSKFFKSFLNKINAFNDSVGFNQPPPAHLKYNYPKANRATINNIGHALATIPRFYTQVLHLMNKMNLPPPFALPESAVKTVKSVIQKPVVSMPPSVSVQREITPKQRDVTADVMIPQIPAVVGEIPKDIHEEIKQLVNIHHTPSTPVQQPPTLSPSPPRASEKRRLSSSESEIESDEEAKKFKEIIPEKRPKIEKKTLKRPKFIPQKTEEEHGKVKTPAKPQETVEEVFEKVEVQVPSKKIELKVTTESLEQTPQPPSDDKVEVNVISTIEPTTPVQEDDDADDDEAYPCISLEELQSNQITDFKDLPLFQNYEPGSPTNKVYIKNCAKTVTTEDLEYIYNRYREEVTEEKTQEFNIRLMKEGRMKGQAFVTLDSVEMAEKAVKETHGFILKDKPLFVAFGKAGTKKK